MGSIGEMIRERRNEKGLTQAELAQVLSVSDKAVSKWENGRGCPDIGMIGPLSAALGISAEELMSGKNVRNSNRSFNMRRMKICVCPNCGNVITASGEAVISCCGVSLCPLEAEEPDERHSVRIEQSEDEYFVSSDHEMTKEHFISFFIAVRDNGFETVKLYPEGNAEARFRIARTERLFWYCNKDGLFSVKVRHTVK